MSSFTKKDSPFIYIQYAADRNAKKKYSKTDVRKDDPDWKDKVDLALTELKLKLLRGGPGVGTGDESDISQSGWGWVITC